MPIEAVLPLPPKQMLLITSMAIFAKRAFPNDYSKAPFCWGIYRNANLACESGVYFGGHFFMPMSKEDLDALAQKGYLTVEYSEPISHVELTDRALLEVKRKFKLDESLFLLFCAFALVDGTRIPIDTGSLGALIGYEPEAIGAMLGRYNFGDQILKKVSGPTFSYHHFTIEGIALIQEKIEEATSVNNETSGQHPTKRTIRRYNLTPRRRHIAAQLAQVLKTGDVPQVSWDSNARVVMIRESWSDSRIDGIVTRADLDALANNKLIKCEALTPTGLRIYVLSRIKSAVADGFGIPLRLRILDALVEMQVKDKVLYSSFQNICDLLGANDGQTQREIEELLKGELLDGRLIESDTFGGNAFYRVTKIGIVEAEAEAEDLEAETMENDQPSGKHIYNNPIIGAINTGPGTANVQQIINPKLSEVLDAIERNRALLGQIDPAKQSEAKEAIDDLRSEVESPTPKISKVKTFAKHALTLAVGIGGFTSFMANIVTVLQGMGVTPEEIKLLLSHFPH